VTGCAWLPRIRLFRLMENDMANLSLRKFPFGKVLISLSVVGTMVGSHAADWNETHIYNPT
jgi:hypothetical protein